ncbi:hypothetical protein L3X38_038421 [Prunus dulcis]|uniref:UBN2_3 domain-containing protein n=1 Tax=Prunus dulcis TaxID=3755 RepID=A0AAD4YS59_PRUDU|nr:hypothetical protein L3X38_038421 [Prunus dulcis]
MGDVSLLRNEGSSTSTPQIVTIQMGYLTGDTPKPHKLSSTYKKWCTENFRVKRWLIDSMSPNLMSLFIRLSTTKQIWAVVKKTYYDGGDETYLFLSQQTGVHYHKYYNQLQGIFPKNDHRSPIHMHCTVNMTDRHIELDRLLVHLFLAGLDPEFDQVRREILCKDPK